MLQQIHDFLGHLAASATILTIVLVIVILGLILIGVVVIKVVLISVAPVVRHRVLQRGIARIPEPAAHSAKSGAAAAIAGR